MSDDSDGQMQCRRRGVTGVLRLRFTPRPCRPGPLVHRPQLLGAAPGHQLVAHARRLAAAPEDEAEQGGGPLPPGLLLAGGVILGHGDRGRLLISFSRIGVVRRLGPQRLGGRLAVGDDGVDRPWGKVGGAALKWATTTQPGEPCDTPQWAKVRCDDGGRVLVLQLEGLRLQGAAPNLTLLAPLRGLRSKVLPSANERNWKLVETESHQFGGQATRLPSDKDRD